MRMLCLDSRVVKHYRVPAPNQEAVLSAFQEHAWARAIDDPLRPNFEICAGVRLRDTVRRLNANQVNHLLRFYGDGTGSRVLWEAIEDVTLPLETARRQTRRAA
jgi:hypothetical protein